MESSSDEAAYVYLEFNDKITSSIFANKMFLRVANLHKPDPVVQINDLLFKGTYDECVGTNIFFEEVENPPVTNIFNKIPPIHLKPTTVQTKVLKLKQMKLPREATSDMQCKESVRLNLDQDYNIVLERLEAGVLNLDDLAKKDVEYTPDEQLEASQFDESPDEATLEPEQEIETLLENVEPRAHTSPLDIKYEKLKRLARRPVRRMKSPERVEDCEAQYRKSYEYHNLERQVCQSSDYFRSLSGPIVEKSFVGGVDIDRCVLQGLLPQGANINYVLTKDEQRKVFSMDNFENLSIPARYLVLKECVSQIESLIETTASEELKECDENGRTIVDICDIFRRLARALELTMAQDDGEGGVRSGTKARIDDGEYVKYHYTGDEFVADMFNSDEWTTDEEAEENKKTQLENPIVHENKDEKMDQSFEESGDSVNEDSDSLDTDCS